MKRNAMGPVWLWLTLAMVFAPIAASADNTPDPCSDISLRRSRAGGPILEVSSIF